MPGELTYSSDEEPGIRRRGGARPRYVDERTGRPVRDSRRLDRITALAVPPAWTDVWICADERGHVQATGRDARGRKQYRYHPEHRRQQEAAKFADLVPFGEALGPLRRRIDSDLDGRDWDFDRVVALVIAVLDTCHVRIGNDAYTRQNGTFGLTTLRNRHLDVDGGRARLHFVGKAGREHDVEIGDRRLARLVRQCSALPGQRLFQWVDVRGERHPVRSSDVNDRLRELTGLEATAKTFRTWGASVRAAELLAGAEPPSSEREAKRVVVAAVDEVAEHLGNTRAVARASYVHPVIPAAYEAGRLADWWHDGPTRSAGGLRPEERRLLGVARRARRAGLGAPASRGGLAARRAG